MSPREHLRPCPPGSSHAVSGDSWLPGLQISECRSQTIKLLEAKMGSGCDFPEAIHGQRGGRERRRNQKQSWLDPPCWHLELVHDDLALPLPRARRQPLLGGLPVWSGADLGSEHCRLHGRWRIHTPSGPVHLMNVG